MNRNELMAKLLSEFPAGVGVEVGSWRGDFAIQITKMWSGTLYMVDVWRGLPDSEYSDLTNNGESDVYKDAINNIRGYEDRAIMIRARSNLAAKIFSDNTLDFVYIDANHAYEYVKQDIESWYPKVKSDGYLMGHDYIKMDWYKDPKFQPNKKDKWIWCDGQYIGTFGVNPAVNEFCTKYGYIPNFTNEWYSTWIIKKI